MKKHISLLTIPFILALILIGCSKFEITNPFYVKDGNWTDPFTLSAIHEEGDSSAIRLDWGRPDLPSIETYRIYRSADDSNSFGKEPIAVISGDTHTYLDTSVVSGKTYFYKMSLIANGKESRHSSITAGIVPVKHVGILEVTHNNAVLTAQNAPSFTYTGYETVTLIVANKGTAPVSLKSLTRSTNWIEISGYVSKELRPDSSMEITIGIIWDSLATNTKAYDGTITLSSSLASAISIPVTALKMSNIGVMKVTNTPEELDFGNSKTSIDLKLNNIGDTTVENCRITTTANWLLPKDTTITAIKKGFDAIVPFTINRELLPEGDNTATLLIDFGVDTKEVTVTASRSTTPKLTVTQGSIEIIDETNVLDFATNLDTLALVVKNSGTGTLVLGKPTLGSGNWISIDASWNDTTRLNSDSSKTLKLICTRSKLTVGENLSTITITGTKGEQVTAKVRAQLLDTKSPRLRVSVIGDSLARTIALKTDDTTKLVELKNVGGSPLKLSRPIVGAANWITVGADWGPKDTIELAPDATKKVTISGDTSKVNFDDTKTTKVTFGAIGVDSDSLTVTFVKPSNKADKVPAKIDSSKTTSKSITLTWDSSKVASFTEYRLYRHTDNSVSNTSKWIATITKKDSLTFTDSDPTLESLKQYFYKVYVVVNNMPQNAVGSDFISETVKPIRTVTGTVTNRNGGKPISGARVILTAGGKSDTVTADEKGAFAFLKNPAAGEGTIAISKVNQPDTFYLADGIAVNVASTGTTPVEPKMTVLAQRNQIVTDMPGAVTSLGASNGMLYAYSNTDRFPNDLSLQKVSTTSFVKEGIDLKFFSERSNPRGFDIHQNGKTFYLPAFYDTSVIIDGKTFDQNEGAIAKVNAFNTTSILEVTGIPYAIEETPAATFVLYLRGTDSIGALKAYEKGQTSFTIHDQQIGALQLKTGDIEIKINDDRVSSDYNICRPLMKISGNYLYMTTGASDQNTIYKIDISDVKNMKISSDWTTYPAGGRVTDMQIIDDHIFVVNGTKAIFVYDLNLKLVKKIDVANPVSRIHNVGGTTSQFGKYVMVLPQFNPQLKDTDRDIHFVSPSTLSVVGTIKATANPSAAVQYDDGRIAVATSDGFNFTNFNLIDIVE